MCSSLKSYMHNNKLHPPLWLLHFHIIFLNYSNTVKTTTTISEHNYHISHQSLSPKGIPASSTVPMERSCRLMSTGARTHKPTTSTLGLPEREGMVIRWNWKEGVIFRNGDLLLGGKERLVGNRKDLANQRMKLIWLIRLRAAFR